MFSLSRREGWFTAIAGMLIFGGLVYAGVNYSQKRSAIALEGLPSSAPVESSAPPKRTELRIDVEGAVAKPGMQTLPPDSRVDDAISAAGGKAKDADTEPLNLAAKLNDGSQVYVPHLAKQEETKVAEPYRGGPHAPNAYSAHPTEHGSTARSGPKNPTAPVSLNTGTAAELQNLPGIGPSTAQKILDYRMEHGGFTSIDEVLAVKGIGPKKLKAMRKWLKL